MGDPLASIVELRNSIRDDWNTFQQNAAILAKCIGVKEKVVFFLGCNGLSLVPEGYGSSFQLSWTFFFSAKKWAFINLIIMVYSQNKNTTVKKVKKKKRKKVQKFEKTNQNNEKIHKKTQMQRTQQNTLNCAKYTFPL